jgi:hypothetical protein
VEDKELMMRKRTPRARTIVISVLALFLIVAFCAVSFAGAKAGTVMNLSGPLLAKRADGTTVALSIHSIVEQGDTLVTEKKTFARIKFIDEGEIVLRPGTQFKIASYNFDQAAPKNDSAVFNLVKGGIRSATGQIGKRGDPDSYKVVTPNAVCGVRGTTYECKICEGNCGSIPNGLYLYVLDGIINVNNNAGSQNVLAGQYVYVQTAASIPEILPGNPGINFTLPPSSGASTKEGAPKNVDSGCVVR